MNSFVTIWSYRIKQDKKKEFEQLYGENGKWISLFKNFSGYLKTELIKDINEDNIYLTLDYWRSKEDYYNFKENSKTEFSEIDKKGGNFTIEEKHIMESVII